MKLLKRSNFTFFHYVFYAICILKSFYSHISVVVCSLFEFRMVSKWCIRECVNKVEDIVGKGDSSCSQYSWFCLLQRVDQDQPLYSTVVSDIYFVRFCFFSSAEHNMLRMSYCDQSLSGVRPTVRPSVNNYLKNLLL